MAHGHFLWTDLSTYDTAAAKADYADLFSWSFHGDGAYEFAIKDGQEVAAVFPMPPRLAEMRMPSFWMSYVHVEDLDGTVAKARTHDGAIVEVEPQAFNADARIALVRDPSGAGVTLYEGPDIAPRQTGIGRVERRYHHLPDIGLIEPFYRDLFGWTFTKTAEEPRPVYDIRHPDGSTVAQAEEVPEPVRGKYRYWIPSFRVRSVDATVKRLGALDGAVAAELTGGRALVADRQGAHFMIHAAGRDSDAKATGDTAPATGKPASISFPWKSLIGLCCIWLAVFLDLQVFWGVLFLIWTWPAIKTGRADFVEPIARASRPIMFWAIVGTWLVLSAWLIVMPLLGSG